MDMAGRLSTTSTRGPGRSPFLHLTASASAGDGFGECPIVGSFFAPYEDFASTAVSL